MLKSNIAVTNVTLNKFQIALLTGDNRTLTATISPSDATNQNLVWSSTNSSIASVDSNGKVVGVSAGSALITVMTEDGNKIDNCIIEVFTPIITVVNVTLNMPQIVLNMGNNQTLTATINPHNATNQNVIWSSNNSSVASIDSNGKVFGVAAGTATITATTEDGNKTATCNVIVQQTYALGDIYYKGGVAIGAVYAISNGGVNGKIISLEYEFGDRKEVNDWVHNYSLGNMGWRMPSIDDLRDVVVGKCGLYGKPHYWPLDQEIPELDNYRDKVKAFELSYKDAGGSVTGSCTTSDLPVMTVLAR